MRRAQHAVRPAVLMTTLAALMCAGCGGRASAPKTKVKARPAQVAGTRLPEWAPRNPSPEFLRAAKVLKPMPVDVLKSPGATDAENAARVRSITTVLWPAAYELFGTLSDAEVRRFLTSKVDWGFMSDAIPPEQRRDLVEYRKGWKRLVIPVKSMTAAQRRALDNWFVAWRKANTGNAELPDYLLEMYKNGAKRDLSNVQFGFVAGGRAVHTLCCITGPKGVTGVACSAFASL